MSLNDLIEARPAPHRPAHRTGVAPPSFLRANHFAASVSSGDHADEVAAVPDAGSPKIPVHVVDPNVPLYLKVQNEGLNSIGTSKPKKIIVVGGGLAGLSAAYELRRAGHNVTILESQNRPGGRVQTVREAFYEDYAEAGAMRLPEAHKCVNNYVNNIFKLPVEVFSGFSPKGYYYLFGKAINIGEYMKNPLPTHKWLKEEHGYDFNAEMLRDENAVNIADMWEHTFQALLKETGYGPSDKEQRAAWEMMCEKYDISFGDYLITYGATEEGRGWKSGTMELFGLIGSGIGGYQSTFVSSFLENVREEISLRTDISNPDSATFHEIIGGNDQLPNAIASKFTELSSPKKLVLGATVIAIRDNHAIDPSATGANRYTVTYRISNSNVECEKSADFIMLTIPFTALRTIDITPAWPTNKARAIRELHYQFASKVMLEFNNRWWNDEKGPLGLPAGGALSTDLVLRNVYFPDHSKDTGRGVVLASYTWEDDALWWASKSRDQQVADALSQLHKLVSALPVPEGQKKLDIRRYFSGGDIKSWSLDPHVSGAYAFFNPGQMSDIFDYITENVGLIFFAGEHASFDHAWIEGAIQSGIREAIRIHKLPEGATAPIKAVHVSEPTKTEEKHSEDDKKDKKDKKSSRKDSLKESKDNLKESKDKLKEKEKSKDKEKEKEKEKEKSKEKSKSKSK